MEYDNINISNVEEIIIQTVKEKFHLLIQYSGGSRILHQNQDRIDSVALKI